MWWQYLIVAIVVGACVVFLVRGMVRAFLGKGGTACGNCKCDPTTGANTSPLGKRHELQQVRIDRSGQQTGA